jgi:hypothetical protein
VHLRPSNPPAGPSAGLHRPHSPPSPPPLICHEVAEEAFFLVEGSRIPLAAPGVLVEWRMWRGLGIPKALARFEVSDLPVESPARETLRPVGQLPEGNGPDRRRQPGRPCWPTRPPETLLVDRGGGILGVDVGDELPCCSSRYITCFAAPAGGTPGAFDSLPGSVLCERQDFPVSASVEGELGFLGRRPF